MVRRIILFFMFFFIINFSVCFCADNLPTINLEQSEAIFNFGLNTSKLAGSNMKNLINNSSAESFMSYFNDFIAPEFYNRSSGEINTSLHFIILISDSYVYVFNTNATLSNSLEFLNIVPVPGQVGYYIYYDYCARLNLLGNNNYSFSFYEKNQTIQTLFYSGDLPTQTPFFSQDYSTLLTDNLYYLGPKPLSDVKFTAPYETSYTWYFLNNYFGGISPSGDTPSGDTPSGDTPSGDTPNYNDKLDNISGLISNTNTKLDGISGEIGQTNNKLDGISGELGEINDNLTTVPDLSGTTINSGDIENALNFQFAEDPYSNFWLEITTGLSNALTRQIRTLNIPFRGKNYLIKLDDFALQVPSSLKGFFAFTSSTFVIWKIIKYIKIMIDKISSGDMDTVLAMNEEERYCRFVLRGCSFD